MVGLVTYLVVLVRVLVWIIFVHHRVFIISVSVTLPFQGVGFCVACLCHGCVSAVFAPLSLSSSVCSAFMCCPLLLVRFSAVALRCVLCGVVVFYSRSLLAHRPHPVVIQVAPGPRFAPGSFPPTSVAARFALCISAACCTRDSMAAISGPRCSSYVDFASCSAACCIAS